MPQSHSSRSSLPRLVIQMSLCASSESHCDAEVRHAPSSPPKYAARPIQLMLRTAWTVDHGQVERQDRTNPQKPRTFATRRNNSRIGSANEQAVGELNVLPRTIEVCCAPSRQYRCWNVLAVQAAGTTRRRAPRQRFNVAPIVRQTQEQEDSVYDDAATAKTPCCVAATETIAANSSIVFQLAESGAASCRRDRSSATRRTANGMHGSQAMLLPLIDIRRCSLFRLVGTMRTIVA